MHMKMAVREVRNITIWLDLDEFPCSLISKAAAMERQVLKDWNARG